MKSIKPPTLDFYKIGLEVNNPKKYKPKRGPYVNPATLKIALIILWSFMKSNNTITEKIKIENDK